MEFKRKILKSGCRGCCRTYDWVVKGGEDVRVDQRVEQLFGACNCRLDLNPGSSSHMLRVPSSEVLGFLLVFMPFVCNMSHPLNPMCRYRTLQPYLCGKKRKKRKQRKSGPSPTTQACRGEKFTELKLHDDDGSAHRRHYIQPQTGVLERTA